MKNICIFLFFLLLPARLLGQESYKQFLAEGKVWKYSYHAMNGNTYNKYLTVKGDTQIDTKSYKKIVDEETGSYECAMREEGSKVYCSQNGNEFLVYDFGLNVGDTFETSNVNATVVAVKDILVGGRSFRVLDVRDNDTNISNWWVEGIGGMNYLMNSIRVPGDNYTFLQCQLGEEVLFSQQDFLTLPDLFAQSESHHNMLNYGKSWVYDYHHFEEHEDEPTTETVYPARYTILGDTLIDNKSYYKMYREVDNKNTYYAAYREDGLKVFARFPLINEDIIVADFEYSGLYDPDGYGDNVSYSAVEEYVDYIEINGIKYRRHTYYEDNKENKLVIGVEGIGYTKYGLQYPSIYGPEPDCLCDYKVFTSCEMNGECIFTNEDFYKEAVAQEHEYIPFVEEGKVWYCGYNHPGVTFHATAEDPSAKGIDCIFTMQGDTVINGKTYKKVYCQFKEYYGDENQHYYCAVREENYRVYIVEEDATEEQQIYDFSDWGETIIFTHNDIKYGRDGGKRRVKFLPGQVEFTIARFRGEELNFSYGPSMWIVAVGAPYSSNPFSKDNLDLYYRDVEPKFGKYIDVRTCMKDGEYIYMDDWRTSHGSPITSIDDISPVDNSPIDFPLYDLQGRRLTSQPSKGVFIKDGKKVVIK